MALFLLCTVLFAPMLVETCIWLHFHPEAMENLP